MEKLQKEWDNVTLSKIFEVEVLDKRTNKIEYITFNISMDNGLFIAQHESMNELQEKSNKIAFTQIEIDSNFGLDSNLQELYSACIDTVMESDFFELP
jgi:hypothetical protein